MTQDIINNLKLEFQAQAEPGYRERVGQMFNLKVDHYYGVRLPVIRKIAGKYFPELRDMDIAECLALCNDLLAAKMFEFKVTAYQWVGKSHKDLKPEHLEMFDHWLETYTYDWADCDDLCSRVLGVFFLRYPDQAFVCRQWAASNNMWKRRAAAVSLIKPLAKNLLLELALQIADTLLQDPEDLVLKGYGWMLKEASKSNPDEVYAFVTDRAGLMPRTAYRYALEKYPDELRAQALQLGRKKEGSKL